MENISLNTIYGTIDLAATSASVEESCPLIPPQALHAGATELDRVKTDPNCIDTREDILKALNAAKISLDDVEKAITASRNNNNSNKLSPSTPSSSSSSSLDEFESVSLKLLGTRYQQLLSINGRMHKQIQSMHQQMKGAIDPFLSTAEEAETVQNEEISPTIQHVSQLKKYCAESVAVIGLARRRQNLKRLDAMLQIAGNWTNKVTTVKESLKSLAFVKALNTVGNGAASFAVDSRSGALSPTTELSEKTSYLLDRREICSLFDESIKNVTIEDEEEEEEEENDIENDDEENQEDNNNNNDDVKSGGGGDQFGHNQNNNAASGGNFSHQSTQPAFDSTDSSSAPTTAPIFGHNNNNNSQQQLASQPSLVASSSQAASHSTFTSPSSATSFLTKAQKRQKRKEERELFRKQSDDVFITFLGKMSFRRWQHLCEPSNPFLLDVIRRSFCCALATGWRGIKKMDQKKIAQEQLLAQMVATQDRMRKEEEELEALMMADNNNNANNNNSFTTGKNNNNQIPSSSASLSPSSVTNRRRDLIDAKPKTKKMRKKVKKPIHQPQQQKQKVKTELDWSSSDDDDNKKKKKAAENVNNSYSDESEYETDTDFEDDDGENRSKNSSDTDRENDPEEGDFNESFAYKNDADDLLDNNNSFNNTANAPLTSTQKKRSEEERQLYERLFSSDQRFWNSPCSPKEIKSCHDIALAVHSALVVMRCDTRAIEEFVKECFLLTTQHVLNYTFDDAFGEDRDEWVQVIRTLVPSEMDRAVLRFCECLCAFVNRAIVVAEIFVDQTLKMANAELMTMNTKNKKKKDENSDGSDDETEDEAPILNHALGLNSTVIIKSLFEIVDRHVNDFCKNVPWTRTSLVEATSHFQTLRVVVCSVLPNIVDDRETTSHSSSTTSSTIPPANNNNSNNNNNNNNNKYEFLRKLVKQAIREDVLRSLDYRITKAISKFSEMSMESVTQLMKSEMFSAFAATTEDFPDTVRPLVLSTAERIRMWGEEEEETMMQLKRSRSNVTNAAPSPGKKKDGDNSASLTAMSMMTSGSTSSFNNNSSTDLLHTPSFGRRRGMTVASLSPKRDPTAKDFELIVDEKNDQQVLFRQLTTLYNTSGALVPVLLDILRTIPSSCYEDSSQPTYSPLDVTPGSSSSNITGGDGSTSPAFTFSSSFCCRKIMDVTRASKYCPSAASALLRTVQTLACSYIYFIANTFLAPNESVPLEDDSTLSEGMREVVRLCKQHACAFGCPNDYPRFSHQPCQMWRQMATSKSDCFAVEQRTGALLSIPVVVSCYRRCVQCVAALLPAEDVQSHMELFDTLSTLAKWSIVKDMRKLGHNLISPDEVATIIEKLKWDAANANASGQAASKSIVTNIVQSTCERLRSVFQYVTGSKQGLNKAMREMFISCTAGLLEGIARVSKKTSAQQGREALMNLVQAVFKMMKGQLPSVSPKLLDVTTKLSSVAGETNAEVIKMFVQSNHASFSVKHLMLIAEGLDTGFMSRGKDKAEVQNMLLHQLRRDDSISASVLLDELCSDWVQ